MTSTPAAVRHHACLMVVALLAIAAPDAIADPLRFMRDPHIASGKIAFSYYGDIWIADGNGANARRLTHHIARDVTPRFSPDGQWVAFTSDRFGNDDVFVVPVTGRCLQPCRTIPNPSRRTRHLRRTVRIRG